jgi:hypothetical protein
MFNLGCGGVGTVAAPSGSRTHRQPSRWQFARTSSDVSDNPAVYRCLADRAQGGRRPGLR